MSIISTEKTISRLPQNVNISAKRNTVTKVTEEYNNPRKTVRNVNARNRKNKFVMSVRDKVVDDTVKDNVDDDVAKRTVMGVDKYTRRTLQQCKNIDINTYKSKDKIKLSHVKNVKFLEKQYNTQQNDDVDYSGSRGQLDDVEYTGQIKKMIPLDKKEMKALNMIKQAATVMMYYLMLFIKAVVAAMSNIYVLVAVCIIVVLGVVVSVLPTVTHNYITDEKDDINEAISYVNDEYANKVKELRNQNSCDGVSTSGQFSDWREIISFWWTIKNFAEEHDEWAIYCTGNTKEDIKNIFYEFNEIQYIIPPEELPVNNESGMTNNNDSRILEIFITNKTMEEMIDKIGMSDNEESYLYDVYNDESVWETILSGNTSGLNITQVQGAQFVWPVSNCYIITSTFKWRWGRQHQGIDFGCPIGTEILAAASGTVTSAGWSSDMGYYVKLAHNGSSTIYMHNSQILVNNGDSVSAGQVIALSGNTGKSTGPHSHFGLMIDGSYVDPSPYLGIPEGFEGDASIYINTEQE